MANKRKCNRGVIVALALVALGAVIGLYELVLNRSSSAGEGGETTPATATPVYALTSHVYTDIRTLRYTREGGEALSFSYDPETEKWSSRDDPAFPVSSKSLLTMASVAAGLTSGRRLEGGDTGSYGFSTPALTVSLVYADGAEDTFTLGSYNSFTGSYYLLKIEDVYLVTSTLLTSFDHTLADLIALDSVPSDLDEDNLSSVFLTGENGETRFTDDEDEILEVMDDSVKAIQLDTWVSAHADASEKETLYGLQSGGASVTLTYLPTAPEEGDEVGATLEAKSLIYRFGALLETETETRVYCTVGTSTRGESGIVYTVPQSVYTALMAHLTEKTPAATEGQAEAAA